jgi:protein gp37
MGADSKIEWCHHTFNPWVGCTKVSPGCDNCYAEAMMDKRLGVVKWGGEPKRTSEANWKKPLGWNGRAKHLGARHRVFCASLADVFDNQVPVQWRVDLWRLIASTPHLDWLLLTKRPQNMARMLPFDSERAGWGIAWPWPNVWLGTTVENQEEADRRIPHLLAVTARVHFLSCEPLLGPVDLRIDNYAIATRLNWVIAGGESGPNARPMQPDWARSLRDQCAAAGVAFHFKQWGEHHPDGERWANGGYALPSEPGESVTFSKIGKSKSGRYLDGRTHDEFPA